MGIWIEGLIEYYSSSSQHWFLSSHLRQTVNLPSAHTHTTRKHRSHGKANAVCLVWMETDVCVCVGGWVCGCVCVCVCVCVRCVIISMQCSSTILCLSSFSLSTSNVLLTMVTVQPQLKRNY